MPYLADRIVVITGAGRGIGRACALLAAAEGAAVVVNDIDGPEARSVAAEITAAGGEATAVAADVSDWAQASKPVEAAIEIYGRVDGLVNNAGCFALADLLEMKEADLRAMVETNLIGVAAVSSHAGRRMARRGRGAIVNVVSGAHFGIPHMSAYAATKGGVASFTYAWSLELDDLGVRVNAVSPLARTRMTALTASWYRERDLGVIDYDGSPAPEINAPPVVWLLSDASAPLTGQILRIEGRQLAVVVHPAVRHPVLEGDWTVGAVDRAFAGPLRHSPVPVGMGPLLQAEYVDGASAFWDGHAAAEPDGAPAVAAPAPPVGPGPIDWASLGANDLPAVRDHLARAAGRPVPGVDIEDRTVPGGGPDGIPVRILRSSTAGDGAPCLYWMHGGGYFSGSAREDDARITRLVSALGLVVVSVDYRLAPEHPFPAGLDDCLAGLDWVSRSVDQLGVDVARLGVGGGSAGGGLAAAVALTWRDRALQPLAFQLLAYPMLDPRTGSEGASGAAAAERATWPMAANRLAWGAYLAGSADGDPYAAPARAADLSRLPPAHLCLAGEDILCAEGLEYGRRLLAAGVTVDLHLYEGAPHGFHVLQSGSEKTRRSLADMERFVDAHIAAPTR